MYMGMSMNNEQRQEMRVSPSLIQYTAILQLSGMELRDLIMLELEENPALAMDEASVCPACGDPLRRDGSCYSCQRGDRLEEASIRDLSEGESSEDDAFDILTTVADQRGLREHLLYEIAALIDEADLTIAEYLIGELDDRGFLDIELDIVAGALEVDLKRVEYVLAALQAVGPVGVGARTVQECLLIQLTRWELQGEAFPLVRDIVVNHWEALGRGQYSQMAQDLGVDYDTVMKAREFIRSHLRPYPISERTDQAPWERQTGPGAMAPDVIVRPSKDEASYEIDIAESKRFRLSINPVYDELAHKLVSEEAAKRARVSGEESQHVHAHVRRAQAFLTHIQERRQTMLRVTAYIMERQRAFLKGGPRHLERLTRAEVAEALDLHESTVSRATKDKFVMLPNRQVVPFAHFFQVALSVKDVLREIVDGEPHPYSDTELGEILAERGHKISRRTVAKYRNAMGILPSTQR
jgi:RNA polymerase sigma-54 factor